MARGLLALLIALSGCLNPDDIFPLRGRVDSVDGLAGLTVELLRDPKESKRSARCDGARPFKTTTTDAEGNFSFDVFRAEVESVSHLGEFCFRVQAQFPSGARAWTDLSGIKQEVTLATLRDWHSGLFVDGGVLQFSPPLPLAEAKDAGVIISHRAQFETTTGELAWQADDDFSPVGGPRIERRALEFDSRRAEAFSGAVKLTALVFEPVPPSNLRPFRNAGSWPLWLSAADTLAVSGGPISLSRGLPCPDVGTPCPLTDGLLTSIDLGGRRSLSFELQDATAVSAIVVRGLQAQGPMVGVALFDADGGQVQEVGSELPVSWVDQLFARGPSQVIGTLDASDPPVTWTVIHLDAGVPVKTVTLRFPSGVKRCAEVSLFP